MTKRANGTWWPDDILDNGGGFTPVANALFRQRERLALSADDLLVVLAILSRVVQKGVSNVRVSTADLVRTTGRSRSTVYRSVERLEARGAVKVTRDSNKLNIYDVRPLFERLRAAMTETAKNSPRRHEPDPSAMEGATPTAAAATTAAEPSQNEDARVLLLARLNLLGHEVKRHFAHHRIPLPPEVERALRHGATFGDQRAGLEYMEKVCKQAGIRIVPLNDEQDSTEYNVEESNREESVPEAA